MLYRSDIPLSKEMFRDPGSEYRAAPFWAWNCRMTKEKIDHTLEVLREMGMSGGHVHCRTGMDNPYLSDEFLDLVKYTHEKSCEKGMLTWLYDEDRWPSGAGGGLVTRDHAYRMRFLLFTPNDQDEVTFQPGELHSSGQAVRSNERTLLGRYQVKLSNGSLTDYAMLDAGQKAADGYDEWFAYLEVSGDNPWFNNEAYLNTLDPKAVQRFVEVTHEKYGKLLGDAFGKTIPSIFTDEPQFSHKQCLGFAQEKTDVTIPYTDDLEDTFRQAYGHSLLAGLPELFWELPGDQVSRIRYEYHDHIAERFAEAFADTVGGWCQAHGIALTGHMMEEPTLETQTAALGEAMRSYRSFHIPGIDMLCDRRELSTAKQAESAVHQYGREGMLSELYGVTNWDFDFRGHKLQGDWQAALGVTVRVPHLTWTTMAGEAKRDYPAAIGYQSPWYREYAYLENYFARVNTALTRGKPHVRIGVIHPIESYWLYWGPKEQTISIREEMDENFQKLIEWLLYGTLDFDFIAESLLPELNQGQTERASLKVGVMEYDVVLVPNLRTIRRSTIEILEAFRERGGSVIFAGEVPSYVDAQPSELGFALAIRSECISFSKNALLNSLSAYRDIQIKEADGSPSPNIIYQMREEGCNRWLFLTHVNRTQKDPYGSPQIGGIQEKRKNVDLPWREELKISIAGEWKATIYDALTGEIRPCPVKMQSGKTILRSIMYDQDSLLLLLEPENVLNESPEGNARTDNERERFAQAAAFSKNITIPPLVHVEMSEDNVSILDLAEYRFDDGNWREEEEILRIDNAFREKLGYPMRMEAFAQPWTVKEEAHAEHTLSLRHTLDLETGLHGLKLAMEYDDGARIFVDGAEVENRQTGWYTDHCIRTIDLPDLSAGKHTLMVEIPYHAKVNVESMFLLGRFGVEVFGRRQILKELPAVIGFSDITRQGLPFYGGNLTYCIPFHSEGGEVHVQTTLFRAPVIKALLDGEKEKHIAFSPYEANLGTVEAGDHMLELTVFGSRINTFGALHNSNQTETWFGPNAWRTEGEEWSYEYQLKPVGLLKAPVITEKNCR